MAAVSDYSYDAKNYDDKMAELCASLAIVMFAKCDFCGALG